MSSITNRTIIADEQVNSKQLEEKSKYLTKFSKDWTWWKKQEISNVGRQKSSDIHYLFGHASLCSSFLEIFPSKLNFPVPRISLHDLELQWLWFYDFWSPFRIIFHCFFDQWKDSSFSPYSKSPHKETQNLNQKALFLICTKNCQRG